MKIQPVESDDDLGLSIPHCFEKRVLPPGVPADHPRGVRLCLLRVQQTERLKHQRHAPDQGDLRVILLHGCARSGNPRPEAEAIDPHLIVALFDPVAPR
jgi:hypothetical protein